jgi:hypothetical protein
MVRMDIALIIAYFITSYTFLCLLLFVVVCGGVVDDVAILDSSMIPIQ